MVILMIILFIGDLHGKLDMMEDTIRQNMDVDFVLQVGDFGAFFDDGKGSGIPLHRRCQSDFPKYISECTGFSKPVFFIKGNHEDFTYLDSLEQKSSQSEPIYIVNNLYYIPNGRVITLHGIKIAAIGGNYSPVCFYNPKSGGKRKHFDIHEFEKIIDVKNIDIFLTHDAGLDMVSGKRFSNLSKELLDFGIKLKPKYWVHGHFHKYYEKIIDNIKIVGLGKIDGYDTSCFKLYL
jgi:predicted phosphodiesterase